MNTDYVLNTRGILPGAQMLFVAFGALVLVPLLTGLDPNVALFTAGAGTLLFQVITRGSIPVFLASSFAFIAPIIYGVQTWGIAGTMCGLMAAGLFYVLLSFLIKLKGSNFLHKLLPPVVTGPVIMVIGLILAPVAVNMAMGKSGDGSAVVFQESQALIVSMATLAVTIAVIILGKKMLRLIPILCGIIAGYLIAIPFGMIDLGDVHHAPWFAVPSFTRPEWNLQAILFIVPVAIAPAIEHFGDIIAIRSVTGKDYFTKPGIHRTMLGDGVATSFASMLGGPPNTTYSEVTGAVAILKVFNPAIMTWAAIIAILTAFLGKTGALLQTIPLPVMGGIMLLLFGAIMVVGLNTLVKSGKDLSDPRRLTIVALILVFGIGGMCFSAGEFAIEGIGLAGISGVILNLILPGKKEATPASEQPKTS
ncbi:MAG: uracil-xanthine permease family protein [Bacteroidales bacterium]|nr:uracil-xanthine permease family protein [Bacteroidales bacterium]